jgi:zinc transport system substrate-binding protein
MRKIIAFFLLMVLSAMGFSQPLQVAVSIDPQRFLVESIGGDTIKVVTIVPAGKNPHSYEPTPSQMKELSRSVVWFSIRIEFEQAIMPKIKSLYPHIRIVDTSIGIKRRIMREEELDKHDHDHDHDEVGAEDTHIWMSVRLMKNQADVVYKTLVEINPSQKALYKKNYENLLKELDILDKELSRKLAPYKGKEFFIYHPVLGYFADDYGLRQISIEIKGKEPSPSQLAKVINLARKHKVKIIFVQEGFSKKSAETVAKAIGGKVVEINPLTSDYLNMMRKIGDMLVEGWK